MGVVNVTDDSFSDGGLYLDRDRAVEHGMALAAAGAAMIIEHRYPSVLKLGIAVFLAMVSATGATSVVGAVEPMVLHRLKFDPATACGPFVTMFNDLFGTSVYFLIATLLHF
jgi:Mg/Co/Ni transporter MgtE